MSVRSGGRRYRSQPCRSKETWVETPRHHRRRRRSPGREADQRQPTRRHAVDSPGGCHSGDCGEGRPPDSSAKGTLRGPGVRLRSAPRATASAKDRADDRRAEHGAWQRPGRFPLGCRAHHQLASPVPPAAHSVRTSCRHPYGVLDLGLYPHLPSVLDKLLLLGALSHPEGSTTTKLHREDRGHQPDTRQHQWEGLLRECCPLSKVDYRSRSESHKRNLKQRAHIRPRHKQIGLKLATLEEDVIAAR